MSSLRDDRDEDFEGWRGWFSELPEEDVDVSGKVLDSLAARGARRPRWTFHAFFGLGAAVAIVLLAVLVPSRPPASLPKPLRIEVALLELLDGTARVDGKTFGVTGSSLPLVAGSEIRLDPGCRARLRAGRARCLLTAGAELRIAPRGFLLRRGRSYVHVIPSGKGFAVTTPLFVCAVRGTRFVVSASLDASRVDLVEGKVEITVEGDPHARAVELSGEASFEVAGTGRRTRLPLVPDADRQAIFVGLDDGEATTPGRESPSLSTPKQGVDAAPPVDETPSDPTETFPATSENSAPATTPVSNTDSLPPGTLPQGAPEIRFMGVGVNEGRR